MILNSKYRYIGLDFETTGLDVTKDEPIQIGLIEIDETGKIIREYQSLIKPDKKTDELKHIVGFITGLSISDLETAPTREKVASEIKEFFGENVIIVGHNVKFDLDFLNAYFPGLKYYSSIDTMQLAQTIVHYAPSYALEVLIENLKDEKLFNEIFKDENHGEEKSHDAFFDTKNSIKVFLYFVKYVHELILSHPILARIIAQNHGIGKELFPLEEYGEIPQVPIAFPPLERITPANITLPKSSERIDTNTLENQKKYYIGNMPIQELLKALATNKNIILAFQNIQKLDIVKAVLNNIGIKNIGFTKEDQTINQKQFQKFLNKGQFNDEELMFVIKYLSHLKKGLGVLNFTNQSDRKIYYYIKDTRNKTKHALILTTHHGLFAAMQEDDDKYAGYDICFFDVENRYKGYNFFLSSPCDLYYTLNILESFLYQKKVDDEISGKEENTKILEEFINSFQIYMGVLSNESTKLFIKTENTMIQHDPIIDHGDFYQSNLLRKQLLEKKDSLQTVLSAENFTLLQKQFSQIQSIFDNVVTITKKMYGNGEFYFTYAESQKYTDRKEFVDIFKTKVIFFSNTNLQGTPLRPKGIQPSWIKGRVLSEVGGETKGDLGQVANTQAIKVIPPVIDTLVKYIVDEAQKSPENISYFIFSPKKDESKKIFEDLCQNHINDKAMLLIENITGGIGKNIFKAKQTKNKILIGGYNFILYCYANKVPLKEIILFNARGPSEQNIIDDIKRYNISN